MAEHIYVDGEEALKAAVVYDSVSKDYSDMRQSSLDLRSDLFGSWEGQAANAFRGTLDRIDACVGGLEQDALIHAGLIRNAEGRFIDEDQYLAVRYRFTNDFTQVKTDLAR
ncbi:MAG: WXG100 family type VII secretion target [Coriobacteriaceae bacterium]|uniref:WXG100 family type VII secretion target n=1 Tax=Tractidigestivibacter sp. TaxID=2847320 RepID=UPI002A90DFF0|nr:WXG100 family type VII secretion target [Tractidigestivibacter sp.]MCI6274484.1 WXG100 family type VII secretion target [Coriobacteriaceae bacterium]MCI7438325.1 WXG100 family type VII secretion target [Coriobacteriaceae bacterium]MDY5271877.1 hypothetical protein [Tractidigestivibacter sp.]